MNVYDFDNTIYNGDSSIDFFLYCMSKKKKMFLLFPKIVVYFVGYKLKLINKNRFKEVFFSFLKYFDNIDEIVELFWKKNIDKITAWYQTQHKKTDVIISASPDFLLIPLEKKLDISRVISTKVDKKNGKFISDNCYGDNKIIFFKNYYGIDSINDFYTDSLSDLPMLKVAKHGFIVKNKKNIIREII